MEEVDDSAKTILLEGFGLSLSDHEHAVHSTISPKMSSIGDSNHPKAPIEDSTQEQKFNHFSLQEELGEGGMGIVYSARQSIPERQVAIKRLKTDRPTMIRSLLDEAMVMGRLSHPNIPPVYQLRMNERNQPEVVMQKIEGKTFQAILDGQSQRGQELKQALQILIQVCHAVEFAHSVGFLHRDIKPENIMVGSFHQVYLMDWGLAVDMNNPQKSRKGLAGTPAYMAPEMLKGEPKILTAAADVYLLGAVLHEILVGTFRHPGANVQESLRLVQASKPYPYPDDVPKMLAELCNQSCAKEPEKRVQTAAEFLERLEIFFEHWEVLKLVEKGQARCRQYQKLWKEQKGSQEINVPLLLQISQQAKFSFEQALDIWPDSEEAKKGLMELLTVMIDQALYANEYHRALVLFAECPSVDAELAERLERARHTWHQDQQRQQKLVEIEKALDPRLTLAPRFLLQRILLISMSFSICFLTWWQLLQDFRLDLEQSFYSMLFTCFPIWLSIAVLYRRLMVNSFGRQAVRTIFYGTLGLVFSHYAGWIHGASITYIRFLDSLLLGLVLINSSPAIKSGPRLGIGCFLMAGLALLLPDYGQYIFHLSAVLIGIYISLEWRKSKFLTDDPSLEDSFG